MGKVKTKCSPHFPVNSSWVIRTGPSAVIRPASLLSYNQYEKKIDNQITPIPRNAVFVERSRSLTIVTNHYRRKWTRGSEEQVKKTYFPLWNFKWKNLHSKLFSWNILVFPWEVSKWIFSCFSLRFLHKTKWHSSSKQNKASFWNVNLKRKFCLEISWRKQKKISPDLTLFPIKINVCFRKTIFFSGKTFHMKSFDPLSLWEHGNSTAMPFTYRTVCNHFSVSKLEHRERINFS